MYILQQLQYNCTAYGMYIIAHTLPIQGHLVPGVSLEAVSASVGVKEVPSLESFILDMRQAVILIGVAMAMAESILVYEKFMKDVKKFLNRILGLKLHLQNLVSTYIHVHIYVCMYNPFPTLSM